MGAWVILELTPKGEKENPQTVSKAITKILRGAEVYVPAVETKVGDDKTGWETTVHYLMHGYAFVLKDREDSAYFKLENGKFVQSVLTATGSTATNKKVATVEGSYIEEMKEKLRAEVNQGIGVGDTVRICSGAYKNIEASVITEIPESKEVQVYVQLRSKQSILTLPRSVLKVIDRAPLSPYFARLGYLRAWMEMTRAVVSYQVPARDLQGVWKDYQQVAAWAHKWEQTFTYIRAGHGRLDNLIDYIQDREARLDYLLALLAQGRKLFSFVHFDSLMSPRKMQELQAKHLTLVWVNGVESRLKTISQEVEELGRQLARGRKQEDDMVVQNVLIDGHNLAFRCLYAPGMSALQDASGRPTGVVLGFVRAIGALKKRFPEAMFWVSWDGSPQRRKSVYGEYKANRPVRDASDTAPIFNQMDYLRNLLPLLGVRQVWHPEEEADDVIGTLVRGELAAQTNIILSTDKDFLQLVTESTMLLVPAISSRKEILYDVEAVQKDFGVPPSKMVELRAFFGDSSDNLPGVPRVPKKILKALLQTHGSVKGVYSSGLSGVTKGQYERLRSAEPQVKINRDLMAIVAVDVQKTDPDVNKKAAKQKLLGLNIEPEPIIKTFFGRSTGSVEE